MVDDNENDRLAIAAERGIITNEQAALIRLIEPDGVQRGRYAGDHTSDGKVVEYYIANLINGHVTEEQREFDVLSQRNERLEVKWSRHRLNISKSESRRWAWGGVLGRSNLKSYDYLILAGEIDRKNQNEYKLVDGQPFVFFVVPFYDVEKFSRPSDGKLLLNITTRKTWGRDNKELYENYMMDEDDIVALFGCSS